MNKIETLVVTGLNFAHRYKLCVQWDTPGTLHLWHDEQKIATVMKKGNSERQVMNLYETYLTDKGERSKMLHNNQSHS